MTNTDLALVIDTFPEAASDIRRCFLADAGFRDLCEEYSLACATFKTFEQRPDAATRPEIVEYRDLIRHLRHDIAEYLRQTDRHARGGAAT